MCFIIWNKCNPCQTIQSIHGTCNTKACYIKLAASDNSTIFHSITEHTDFPAESPQIQFLIENSTKLLAHELTMLNANTDIELYYISVTRRCNCSWQGLLHFFSFFSSFDSVMLLFKLNTQWQKHPVIIFVGFRMHPIRSLKQYFCFIYWLVAQTSYWGWSGGLLAKLLLGLLTKICYPEPNFSAWNIPWLAQSPAGK